MKRVHVLLGAGIAIAPAARAQEPAPPPPVTAEVTLGFVSVSGNTEVTTFSFGDKLGYATGRWHFTQTFKSLYGETDGSSTAEAYEAVLRGEYALGARFTTFAFGGWTRNTFAGIAERWAEGVGVGYKTIQAPLDTLVVEDALSLEQQRNIVDARTAITVNRAGLAYRHYFGTSATFSQTLEWLANLKTSADQRINSETAITAPISKQIALRAAYTIRFDSQPEPGFEDTDRVFNTGLQIVF